MSIEQDDDYDWSQLELEDADEASSSGSTSASISTERTEEPTDAELEKWIGRIRKELAEREELSISKTSVTLKLKSTSTDKEIARFEQMVKRHAELEEDQERKRKIRDFDSAYTREKREKEWKREHDLQIEYEMQSNIKNDAESRFRWGDREHKRDQYADRTWNSLASNIQVV